MTRTWQYRLLALNASSPAELHRQLEEMGAEGWELVAALESRHTLIFKRAWPGIDGHGEALKNPPEPDVVTGT